MSGRPRLPRVDRSPGFALPAAFLTVPAMLLASWFGVVMLVLAWVLWRDPDTPRWIAPAPLAFAVAAFGAAFELLRACAHSSLKRSIRAARAAWATVLAAALAQTAYVAAYSYQQTGWKKDQPYLGIFVVLIWVFMSVWLVPLFVIDRRLTARARAGNPAWDPYQATSPQRGGAVVFFSMVIWMGLGLMLGLSYAVVSQGVSADGLSNAIFSAHMGVLLGALFGGIPGSMIGPTLSDSNLSRALPPVALATLLVGAGGALVGTGTSLFTVGLALLAMLTTAWFHARRFRLFPSGCCRACGYSLAGLDDEAPRCPECGKKM